MPLHVNKGNKKVNHTFQRKSCSSQWKESNLSIYRKKKVIVEYVKDKKFRKREAFKQTGLFIFLMIWYKSLFMLQHDTSSPLHSLNM